MMDSFTTATMQGPELICWHSAVVKTNIWLFFPKPESVLTDTLQYLTFHYKTCNTSSIFLEDPLKMSPSLVRSAWQQVLELQQTAVPFPLFDWGQSQGGHPRLNKRVLILLFIYLPPLFHSPCVPPRTRRLAQGTEHPRRAGTWSIHICSIIYICVCQICIWCRRNAQRGFLCTC